MILRDVLQSKHSNYKQRQAPNAQRPNLKLKCMWDVWKITENFEQY